MKRKAVSMALALLLIALTGLGTFTVNAAEDNLVELLEYGTVNNSGSNMFQFSTSVTVEIDVPMYTNLRYIDVTFMAHDGVAPTAVYVYYNGNNQGLTVKQISQDVYRAYGNIGGYYDSVYLSFYASGTQYYTIQSCKVSSLKTSFFNASAKFNVQIAGTYFPGTVGTLFESPHFDNSSGYMGIVPYQAEIEVTDTTKYDSVNLQFAVTYLSINSIRCTYGNVTVPFTVNFIDVNTNETYTYYFNNIGEEFSLHAYGKYIGSIEVDLSGIDRAAKTNLLVYFNGDGMSYGFTINVSSVMGTVYFADTSDATWWHRFTDFMSGLFNPDSSAADEFRDDASNQVGQLEDMNQQLEQIQRPSVDDIEMGVDSYVPQDELTSVSNQFRSFTQHPMILTMTMVSLTIALCGYVLYGKR